MMALRVLFLSLTLLAALPAGALSGGAQPPAVLGHAPDRATLHTADYAGRILVVTFWASWCGPCLNEMKVLERLQREAGDRLAVVSINIETAARFRELRRTLAPRLSLTLAHDRDGSVRKAWGVGPIPHLFIVDQQGRIVHEHRGYDDAFIPTLVANINRLLAQPPASAL